jgi:hypothetical protein
MKKNTFFLKIGFTMKTFSLKTLLMAAVSLGYVHTFHASNEDDISSETHKKHMSQSKTTHQKILQKKSLKFSNVKA